MQSYVNPFWITRVCHVVEGVYPVFMYCPNFKQKFKCFKNNVQGTVSNALGDLLFKNEKNVQI